jgi:hypothetical protein
MSDNLDNDMLNDLEGYNWDINDLEDQTQSDCDHNCSPTPDLDIKIEINEVRPYKGRRDTQQTRTFDLKGHNWTKTNLTSEVTKIVLNRITTKRLLKVTTKKSTSKTNCN